MNKCPLQTMGHFHQALKEMNDSLKMRKEMKQEWKKNRLVYQLKCVLSWNNRHVIILTATPGIKVVFKMTDLDGAVLLGCKLNIQEF